MNKPINFIGGLAGAFMLKILHATGRKLFKDAPPLQKISPQITHTAAENMAITAPSSTILLTSTLGSDLVANTLYYSLIGDGSPQSLWVRGAVSGITAGVSVLKMKNQEEVISMPFIRKTTSRFMTLSWYMIAGLTAAAVIKAMQNNMSKLNS